MIMKQKGLTFLFKKGHFSGCDFEHVEIIISTAGVWTEILVPSTSEILKVEHKFPDHREKYIITVTTFSL